MKLCQLKYFKGLHELSFIHVAKYFVCESAAPNSLKGKVKNVAEGFRRVQLVGEERRKREEGGGEEGWRESREMASRNYKREEEEILNINSTK